MTPTHSHISHSGRYLLTGSSNGVLRVHALPPLPPSLSSPSSLGSYWALSMHDNHTGAITHLCSTYDDSYVVSAGADGNVFVYSASLPTATPNEKSPETLEVGLSTHSGMYKSSSFPLSLPPSSFPLSLQALPQSKPAKDIDDPNHYRWEDNENRYHVMANCALNVYSYSIEDAKQKTEHDRRVKQAEMRKQNVRREVGRLRRTFLQLMQRNTQLGKPLQLPANEFIMDPSLEAGMRERAQQQVPQMTATCTAAQCQGLLHPSLIRWS